MRVGLSRRMYAARGNHFFPAAVPVHVDFAPLEAVQNVCCRLFVSRVFVQRKDCNSQVAKTPERAHKGLALF